MIVGGRNVCPEDIERACNDIDGVRPGNVIAFGVDTAKGKEGMVVVAEARPADDADLALLRAEVHDRVKAVAGIPAKDVVLVASGTPPKTRSGKLKRAQCRRRPPHGPRGPPNP